MARPKEFDHDEVLEKAMQVFWAKGYECTSMQNLVDAMGINRGSLYATFGDKHSLHLAALDRYYRDQINGMLAPLSGSGSKLAAIREIFQQAADCAARAENRKGCMIYNTAIEMGPGDADVAAKVRSGLRRIEQSFHTALAEAQAAGELAAEKKPLALARHLTNALSGLRVMTTVFDDRPTIDDIVNATLAALD